MKAQHNAYLTYAGRTPKTLPACLQMGSRIPGQEASSAPPERCWADVSGVGWEAGNPSHASFPYSPYQRSSR